MYNRYLCINENHFSSCISICSRQLCCNWWITCHITIHWTSSLLWFTEKVLTECFLCLLSTIDTDTKDYTSKLHVKTYRRVYVIAVFCQSWILFKQKNPNFSFQLWKLDLTFKFPEWLDTCKNFDVSNTNFLYYLFGEIIQVLTVQWLFGNHCIYYY